MTDYTKHFKLVKPDFNVIGWHDPVNDDFDAIDAALYAITGLTGINGNWANSTDYVQGDRVFDPDDGTLWQAAVTHTSATLGTFAADRAANPTYWIIMDTGFSIRGAWTTATFYQVGDMVYDTTEHVVAVCVVAHTSTTDIRTDQAAGKWVWLADLKADIQEAHANADDALQFQFSNIITDADPGDGKIQLNNAAPGSATMMFADNIDMNGVSMTAILDSWDDSTSAIKGIITFRSKVNAAVRHHYQLTGAVVVGVGYRKLPLSYISGSGTFVNGETVFAMINRYGNTGPIGPGSGDVLAANNGTEFVAAIFRNNLSIYSKSEIDNYINTATAKGSLVDADKFAIADSAAAGVQKSVLWSVIKSTLGTYFFGTGKTTPVDADAIGITDSAAGGAPKSVTFANLKTWITAYLNLTNKASPVSADRVMITDSAASFAQKYSTIAQIQSSILNSAYQAASTVLSALAGIGTAVQGDLIYGSGAGTWARLAKGGAAFQALLMNSGATLPAWTTIPVTRKYDSGQQVITSGGALTLAHGFGVKPTAVTCLLQCTSADNGYSVGDELYIGVPSADGSVASGVSVVLDATNINIRYGSRAGQTFLGTNKSTGGNVALSNGSWAFVVRAFA